MSTLKLGQEYIPSEEEEVTREITRISEQILKKDPPVKRGEHPKSHGCVRGEFIVDPNLPEDAKFRVGVFQEPGKRYPVCIRFSNFSVQDDRKGDAHGMAMKLFGVPGDKVLEDEKQEETQDFLMIDYPLFVVRNAKDYFEFFAGIEHGKDPNPMKFFIPSWNPFTWRWHELKIALGIRRRKLDHLLRTQYWSTTPYKLGSNAIKFSVKPAAKNGSGTSSPQSENYLREGLRSYLKNQDASFDFFVQFQTDAEKMPVEDPTIKWNSPDYKVATVNIPSQTFESPEQEEFGENLSFTPWHSLPEHRPLGGINRPRKQIYETISRLRNQLNGVPHQEPTIEKFSSIFPLDSR